MTSRDLVGQELKGLARQSSHYLLGLMSSLALGFVSFPIFTRIFSIADYGMIDYAQKILLLLTALSKAGAQNSAMRFYDRNAFEAHTDLRLSYYSTMLLGVGGVSTLFAGLFASLIRHFPTSIVDASLASLLTLGSILIAVRSVQSIQWAFLRIEERTKAYNLYGFIVKAGTIAAVLALLPLLGASVRTYFLAMVLVESVMAAIMMMPLLRRKLLSFRSVDLVLLRAGFAFGLPLVLQEIAGIVLDSGDRALIQRYLGNNPLGLYSVAYGLSSYVNTLLMTPLGLAILPIFMRIWRTDGKDKTSEFLSTSMDIFAGTAAFILMLVLVGSHDAVLVMASAKYAGSDRLIPMLVAGLLIYTAQVFLNAGLLIHKRTLEMALALAGSAVLNVALNCVLLPRMGIMAAALATLLSYAVCTLWLAQRSFRVLPVKLFPRSLATYGFALLAGWQIASRTPVINALADLVLKSLLACSVFIAVLLVFDQRARSMLFALIRRARSGACMSSGVTVSL